MFLVNVETPLLHFICEQKDCDFFNLYRQTLFLKNQNLKYNKDSIIQFKSQSRKLKNLIEKKLPLDYTIKDLASLLQSNHNR